MTARWLMLTIKCYSISKQEPTGEARIDERASLVVSFAVPNANPIPLRGMVDTGSGVSIMSCSAFNRVALTVGLDTLLEGTHLLPR